MLSANITIRAINKAMSRSYDTRYLNMCPTANFLQQKNA